MNVIIKIIKKLEVLAVLIDAKETVKDDIKQQDAGFLGALSALVATSIVQPVFSSVVKG